MKKNKKKLENPYCDFSFFMIHGCNGCKRSKKCEEWYYANRIKRDQLNRIRASHNFMLEKKQK